MVDHQAGQGAEHLAEALDPEPGLGDHDEIVEDPGTVVGPGDPHTEGQVPGVSLAPGVPHHEGADWSLRQESDCQVPGQAGLVPGGSLVQLQLGLHEGEVDDTGLFAGGAVGAGAAAGQFAVSALGLLAGVAAQTVVVVVVHHCRLRVGKIVHNFLQRSSSLLVLVVLAVVVTPQFVLHLIVEQQIVFHLKVEARIRMSREERSVRWLSGCR